MNKSELVTGISTKAGITKKDAELALKAFIETVQDAIKEGEKVQLIGFGTFEQKDIAERETYSKIGDPTSPKVTSPASKGVKFKAGSVFKDVINNR